MTNYTHTCIVLAISYTNTKPKNNQLTLVNPNISYSQHWLLNECRYPKNSILDRIKLC